MSSILSDLICYLQDAVVETIRNGADKKMSDEDVRDAIESLCASIYDALCAIRTPPKHITGTFSEKCDKLLCEMTDCQLLDAADIIARITGYSPLE